MCLQWIVVHGRCASAMDLVAVVLLLTGKVRTGRSRRTQCVESLFSLGTADCRFKLRPNSALIGANCSFGLSFIREAVLCCTEPTGVAVLTRGGRRRQRRQEEEVQYVESLSCLNRQRPAGAGDSVVRAAPPASLLSGTACSCPPIHRAGVGTRLSLSIVEMSESASDRDATATSAALPKL